MYAASYIYMYMYIEYHATTGVTKADYGELMKEDGLDIEKMETKAREFTLSGDYRRMLARAGVCVALIEP